MAKKPKFDIGEDIEQQQALWRIERIAWALMALVIIGALLGFVGHGRYSERVAGVADTGIAMTYQRFERYQTQTLFTVRLAAVPEGGQTRLRVGQNFLRHVEMVRIEPAPERVELDGGFMTYVFNTPAPGLLVFHYRPLKFGSLQIEIGLEGAPPQRLPQFVYP